MTLIAIENLSIYGNQGKGSKPIVQNINMKVDTQDIVAIVGPSGAGKTTLMKGLALLNHENTKGKYYYNQNQILPLNHTNHLVDMRKRIIFIHQAPTLFKGTVKYNIEYGFHLRKIKIDKEVLNGLINSFNLSHVITRNVKLLSGGEKQRVCILRALALEPEVLILDEPTQNLDPLNIKIIEENLKNFQKRNGTVIIVTHNLFQAQRISNKLGILQNGTLIEFGETEKLFSNPEKDYTSEYLSGKAIF